MQGVSHFMSSLNAKAVVESKSYASLHDHQGYKFILILFYDDR